ncbi:17042_t:CDS:1, partial [Racocetra persica]
KEIADQIKYSGTGGENYTAQTIVEPGEGITINIPYTASQRGYSHSTFIRLTNSSVMDDFKNAVVSSSGCNAGGLHYSSSQGFCWGCTYDELKKHNFVQTKFTPSANCSVLLKLDVSSSEIKDLDLKAGVEYTVTITETQFIFKEQDRTKIVIQKQPGHDNFDNLD